ncbi:hypothetical protein HN385_04135 [archaeon]|jgi:hypothetical protein|nr:hypothetical protein [archaeon]MBT3451676.1 hypothetical protein [archaeon]MBT6869120.1 hypothetical protein [archaeon]MBT7193363.1 hypothetical protein [archaeon]MBT7380371.1 hypothetical protein [archaeon]
MSQNKKNIAALLAVALMVSFSSTLIIIGDVSDLNLSIKDMLTGAVTSQANGTGTAELEILANVGLNVDDAAINLGSGYVNGSNSSAIVDSMNFFNSASTWLNSTGQSVSGLADYHLVNNTGSTPINITVQMNSHVDAEDWLCGASGATCPGDNADVRVRIQNAGTSCLDIQAGTYEANVFVTNVNKNTVLLCGNMKPIDGQDTFEVYYKVEIPQEAPTGSKEASFLYTAEAQ